MARLLFTRHAQRDLQAIASYIAQDNPDAAASIIDRLEKLCTLVASRPLMGRPRSDVRPGLRSVLCGRYVIFYRPLGDGAEIVRVIHAARDLHRAIDEPPRK